MSGGTGVPEKYRDRTIVRMLSGYTADSPYPCAVAAVGFDELPDDDDERHHVLQGVMEEQTGVRGAHPITLMHVDAADGEGESYLAILVCTVPASEHEGEA